MTLFLGIFVVIIAIFRGVYVYQSILAKQRNAAARYMPEYESKITPKKLVKYDKFVRRLTHGGGPEIKGRNDQSPQQRASYFRATLVDSPITPPTSQEPAATTQGQQPEAGVSPQP